MLESCDSAQRAAVYRNVAGWRTILRVAAPLPEAGSSAQCEAKDIVPVEVSALSPTCVDQLRCSIAERRGGNRVDPLRMARLEHQLGKPPWNTLHIPAVRTSQCDVRELCQTLNMLRIAD